MSKAKAVKVEEPVKEKKEDIVANNNELKDSPESVENNIISQLIPLKKGVIVQGIPLTPITDNDLILKINALSKEFYYNAFDNHEVKPEYNFYQIDKNSFVKIDDTSLLEIGKPFNRCYINRRNREDKINLLVVRQSTISVGTLLLDGKTVIIESTVTSKGDCRFNKSDISKAHINTESLNFDTVCWMNSTLYGECTRVFKSNINNCKIFNAGSVDIGDSNIQGDAFSFHYIRGTHSGSTRSDVYIRNGGYHSEFPMIGGFKLFYKRKMHAGFIQLGDKKLPYNIINRKDLNVAGFVFTYEEFKTFYDTVYDSLFVPVKEDQVGYGRHHYRTPDKLSDVLKKLNGVINQDREKALSMSDYYNDLPSSGYFKIFLLTVYTKLKMFNELDKLNVLDSEEMIRDTYEY